MDLATATALLTRWSAINSGSDAAEGLRVMGDALAEGFRLIPDVSVEAVALPNTGAKAIRVTCRETHPFRILFSGHYDTVYGRDHPFQTTTRVDGTTLRGPGVADMKGGLVVLLSALLQFEALPGSKTFGWEALFTPDEEIGSPFSASLIREAAARSSLGLVFEPARENGDLVRARMGTGIFTLACHGRAAHAGRDPKLGRNAIVELARVIGQVDALGSLLPQVLINVGRIEGGGAVNIVPPFAKAEVNIRIARASDAREVLSRLDRIAESVRARDGYRLEVSGQFNRLPKEIGPEEERLFGVWQALGALEGLVLGWQDVGGGSDGNLMSEIGLPSLDGLGVVGGCLHSPEEYALLPSLTARASLAVRFLNAVNSGEVPLPGNRAKKG